MHNINWDDLRLVLSVVQHESISKAAKALGVANTTVLRRITAFETEAGVQIFEKTSKGYIVNHDQQGVIDLLLKAGEAVKLAENHLSQRGRAHQSSVRITSTDTMCQFVLPKIVSKISSVHPEMTFSLLSSNTHLNLGHGAADLTVRIAERLPDDLLGEKVAHLGMAVYSTLKAPDKFLDFAGPLTRSEPARWLRNQSFETSGFADSFLVLKEMVASGMGNAILPSFLGDADQRLNRISGPKPVVKVPIWVASHHDLGDSQKSNQAKKLVADGLRKNADWLSGKA